MEISEEAEIYVRDFFKLCSKKFSKGEIKYGYLRGDTDFRKIYEHLLCEFGELIYSVDGKDAGNSLDLIKKAIISRSERKNDRNIPSELADVTNIPVLVYVCGRIQGLIQIGEEIK